MLFYECMAKLKQSLYLNGCELNLIQCHIHYLNYIIIIGITIMLLAKAISIHYDLDVYRKLKLFDFAFGRDLKDIITFTEIFLFHILYVVSTRKIHTHTINTRNRFRY